MTIERKKEIRSNRDALVNAHQNNAGPANTVNALIASIGYNAAAEIIAVMVNAKGIWDQRISQKARAWAAEIAADALGSDFIYYCDEIHPAHMDQIAREMMNTPEPTPEAKKEEPEPMNATETKNTFPNLIKAVDEYHDNELREFSAAIEELTNGKALENWYYRNRMTAAAKKMIEEAEPGAALPESAKNKMLARFARETEKQRAKYLEKIAAAEAAPEPEYIVINIEWKRSATWGMNPHAEISGERTRTTGSASGCGYDKASAAAASAANQHPEILRILYTHAERGGEFPYSVYTFAGLPYFDGGCGMSCFYNVFEACGYRFKQTANGKTFDAYAIIKEDK